MKYLLPFSCLLALVIYSLPASGQKQETGTIYGRVTDLLGAPIQGARLQFFSYQRPLQKGIADQSEAKLLQGTTTDESGNYQLAGLPSGTYKIDVSFTGFVQAHIGPVYLSNHEKRLLDVGLQVGQTTVWPSTEIAGVVGDSSKAALRNATVTVISAFNQQVIKQVRTDASGRYQVGSLGPSQYVVYASKPGFAVSTTSATLNLGDHKTADFTLSVLPPQRGQHNP